MPRCPNRSPLRSRHQPRQSGGAAVRRCLSGPGGSATVRRCWSGPGGVPADSDFLVKDCRIHQRNSTIFHQRITTMCRDAKNPRRSRFTMRTGTFTLRKRWDSNPRSGVAAQWFSRPSPSAARTRFQGFAMNHGLLRTRLSHNSFSQTDCLLLIGSRWTSVSASLCRCPAQMHHSATAQTYRSVTCRRRRSAAAPAVPPVRRVDQSNPSPLGQRRAQRT